MYLIVCPFHAPVLTPPVAKYSVEFFLTDHTLPTRPKQAWKQMGRSPLNGTKQYVDIGEEGRCQTKDRDNWLKQRKPSQERTMDQLDSLTYSIAQS